MPIFERPDLESLPPARQRWTPLYLEHGRLEVDDSSVKWIGADCTVIRIPVATVSALMLGPDTTVTHAAVKACAESNTPICWIGAEGLRFYALGVFTTHNNDNARHHVAVYSSCNHRTEVARRMFARRFPDLDVATKSIQELRGLEGQRVRNLYAELGVQYGVTWKGRRYSPDNWNLADNINKAISAANAALYSVCTAVVCSLGYLPQLGFIHSEHPLAFVFDIADLYKHQTTLPAAFQALAVNAEATEKDVLSLLKMQIEKHRVLHRMPDDIKDLLS